MAVDTDYSLAMSDGICSGAPYGTSAPTDFSSLSSPWYDFGAITTDGLSETEQETRTSFKRWGDINPYKTVVTDQAKSFDVSFLETNAHVLGLFFKVTDPTPTGTAHNETQTVTITGSPTGGDFVLVFGDQATTDIAYNATASAVQTALQALSTIGSGNATVTGSAGGPYTVTFASALADQNVPALTATVNLTGGTSPGVSIATTQAGAAGNVLSFNDDVTGKSDIRAFCFDVVDGTNHGRFFIPKGEVTARKNITYKTDTQTEYGVTVSAYTDPDTGIAIARMYLLDAVS